METVDYTSIFANRTFITTYSIIIDICFEKNIYSHENLVWPGKESVVLEFGALNNYRFYRI